MATDPKPDEQSCGGPVALVLDDDPLVVRALARQLASHFSVLSVGTVRGALCWLQRAPRIDLAVLDYELPDGSGSAVLRELRARHPAAARVLMSGASRLTLPEQTLRLAHVFLQKPLDARIVEVIRGALERTGKLDK